MVGRKDGLMRVHKISPCPKCGGKVKAKWEEQHQMSMRTRTTYLATCDYPGCCMVHEFWESTEEHAIENVIDDCEWLCLFTGDNEPRFFCPLHLRYRPDPPYDSPTVFFDSDSPATQPTLHALNRFYEDMSTPQPLPKLECEDTILAILQNEN